jgi:hypothetical protein
MSDERRPRSDAQLSADDPSGTGTTIVGGQPAVPRQPLREVTVGLEKVLFLAALEPGFRAELLRDREAAIRARGLALQGSELAMLKLAPASQLAASIDALDTSEANLARRGFMRAVAGAVTLAAGSVLAGVGCNTASDGVRPDPVDGGSDGGAVRGIQPDLPRIDSGLPNAGVRANDGPMPAGIRPDGGDK